MINWIKEKLGYKYCYVICYKPRPETYCNNWVKTTRPITLDNLIEIKNGLANTENEIEFEGKDCLIINIMFLGMSKENK